MKGMKGMKVLFMPAKHAKYAKNQKYIFPGSAGGYPPTPPQTRTSTINASGSSWYGFAKSRSIFAT